MRKLCFLLVFCCVLMFSFALSEPLQDCHKVTLTYHDTKQANKSVVRLWEVDTALDSVDNQINAIASDWAQEIAPTLKKAANYGDKGSRVDVEISYSRTGLTWMSLMVQARTSYHRNLLDQRITSRTYNMETGDRILLTDIFPDDSPAWEIIREAVKNSILSYYPDEQKDSALVEAYTTREAIEKIDFTLHGLSMILYLKASDFTDHHTLIETTLFYPDIREYMTDEAKKETDNLSYYKTVALTFDDGPTRTNTSKVINNLTKQGIRATFFLIGNRISSYVDQVQREHDHAHQLGYHNWTHANVTKTKASTLRAMKEKCDNAMLKAVGTTAHIDRVPYGLYPQMIKAKVGWPLIQWSLDTYDWRGRSVNTIMSSVKKQISDGDIILCHDIKDNTPDATLKIAEYLQKEGYMFLTIDELFRKDNVTLQPDTVYFHCDQGDTSIKKR